MSFLVKKIVTEKKIKYEESKSKTKTNVSRTLQHLQSSFIWLNKNAMENVDCFVYDDDDVKFS